MLQLCVVPAYSLTVRRSISQSEFKGGLRSCLCLLHRSSLRSSRFVTLLWKHSSPGTQDAGPKHQAPGPGLPRRSFRIGSSLRPRISRDRSEELFTRGHPASGSGRGLSTSSPAREHRRGFLLREGLSSLGRVEVRSLPGKSPGSHPTEVFQREDSSIALSHTRNLFPLIREE